MTIKHSQHFDDKGFLRSARHEGKVARFMGKTETDCPYSSSHGMEPGIVETSWKHGFHTARVTQ